MIDYQALGLAPQAALGYHYNSFVRTYVGRVEDDWYKAERFIRAEVPAYMRAYLSQLPTRKFLEFQASVATALDEQKEMLAALERQDPEIRTGGKAIAFPAPLIAASPYFSCIDRQPEETREGIKAFDDERAIFHGEPAVRVVGDLCASVPVIKIQAVRTGQSRTGVGFNFASNDFRDASKIFVLPEHFYSDSLSADDEYVTRFEDFHLYENGTYIGFLTLLEAIAAVRLAQCGDFPSTMTLVVELQANLAMNALSSIGEIFEPILKADLYLAPDGIDGLVVYDDEKMLAAMQQMADELARFQRSIRRPPSDDALSVGALVILGGIVAMSMNSCYNKPKPSPGCPDQ